MQFFVKRNDTQPRMLARLTDGYGAAINLTDCSVRFHMKLIACAIKIDASAAIVTPLEGVVRYDWQPSDTNAAGSYKAEFEVTYPDNTIETFPNDSYIRVEIIDDIT